MRYGRLPALLVCLLVAGMALGADEVLKDGEEATAAGPDVPALAKAGDIALTSSDRLQAIAELRAVFKNANPHLDVETGGFEEFAESLLAGACTQKIAAAYVERKQAGYAIYLALEKTIKACKAPDAFKTELERYWSRQHAAIEMVTGDTVEAAKTIAAIPSGWDVAQVDDEKALCAEFARRCPRFADTDAGSRKRVLDWIAAFNPRVRAAGFRVASAGRIEEPWLHTVLPLDGGKVRVCLYQLTSGGPVLLPPNDEALESLPAAPPDEAYDCSMPVIERTSPSARRWVLRFQSVPKPGLCDLWEITLHGPAGDGRLGRGFSTMPLVSNIPKPLAHGLSVSGNRTTGTVTLTPWTVTVEAATDPATGGVSGRFSAVAADSKSVCTGRVVGLSFPGAWLDDAREGRQRMEKALAGAGLSPQSTARIGKDFARPLGPAGSGAATDTGAPLVDSLAQARFCWRGEEEVPGSYAATPQGGYASPLVWDGDVYQMFYDLPTDDMFGNSYFDMWMENLRKNDPSKLHFEEALRRKCSVSAHDVVACLDGQTGRTKWKATFVRKGGNYSFQARGMGFISTKTGPVGTPSIVDGRVYFRGSSGRVYCLDASDGSLIWESTIGWRHDQIERLKRACRRMKMPYGAGYDLCSSSGVSDGVVVLHGHNGRGTRLFWGEGDLLGLDARTGKALWLREGLGRGFNSPMPWRHRGREYVFVSADALHCLEPKTGRTLWTIPGATMDHKTPLDENHIVVGTGKERIGCYRIAPAGATRLWEVGFAGANPRGLILGGRVFIPASPEAVCLDLETGAILGRQPGGWLHVPPSGVGDRAISDTSNGGGGMRMYRLGGDGGLAHLGDHGIPTTCCTTPAIADGRLVARGRNEVLCYDLRRDPERDGRIAAQLAALLGAADPLLEEQVVRGLAQLGPGAAPAVAGALDRAVASADARKVYQMGRTIGAMPAPIQERALPVLVGVVKGDEQIMASAAAQALGSWGKAAVKAVPALRDAMQLAQPAVERACREAVRAIELGANPPSPARVRPDARPDVAPPPARPDPGISLTPPDLPDL